MQIPYAPAGDGESYDEGPPTDDRWTLTLGQQQYNWLKQTLENSNASYKFMFAHHMVGGIHTYARGGAAQADMFEWGGYNADGSWGFDTRRPGWGITADHPNGTSIHQLMVDNNVSAFFHGHDHQYVYETRDGIVYQEVPSPSMNDDGPGGIYEEGIYWDYQTIKILPNSGHLRVTVTPEEATVEYVRSDTSTIAYTYTIEPPPTYALTIGVDPDVGGSTNPAVGVHSYVEGTVVNVTAAPAAGYAFDHWSGACTGSGACQVTMDAAMSVTATFTLNRYTLSVGKAGNGSGTVTSSPAGISCGTTCSSDYDYGTQVTLTAAPSTGTTFTGWSGACTGTGSCIVTMDAAKPVTAHFTELLPTCHTLTISHTGQGSDPLASPTNSTGCPSGQYVEGETIDLSGAIPDSGWRINAWTGTDNDASTANTNAVTMPATDHAVSVIYKVHLYIPMIISDVSSSGSHLPQLVAMVSANRLKTNATVQQIAPN